MDNFQSIDSISDKFKLGKKWFWIGIIVAVLNGFAGLIYGIALAVEKERRKEGLIIAVLSIIWTLVLFFFLVPNLQK